MARGMDEAARALGYQTLCDLDDPLARYVQSVGPLDAPRRRPRFAALCTAIIGQQLSTKAAATIRERVRVAAGGRITQPGLSALDDETLRSLGLSRQKLSYVRALCEAVSSGELRLDQLHRRDDEAVIAELVRVRGLGVWSAQMFLMFTLRRPDVLPVDDLGIQNAMLRLFDLPERPKKQQMLELAEGWRPYRSIACQYLWHALDNAPE